MQPPGEPALQVLELSELLLLSDLFVESLLKQIDVKTMLHLLYVNRYKCFNSIYVIYGHRVKVLYYFSYVSYVVVSIFQVSSCLM